MGNRILIGCGPTINKRKGGRGVAGRARKTVEEPWGYGQLDGQDIPLLGERMNIFDLQKDVKNESIYLFLTVAMEE